MNTIIKLLAIIFGSISFIIAFIYGLNAESRNFGFLMFELYFIIAILLSLYLIFTKRLKDE